MVVTSDPCEKSPAVDCSVPTVARPGLFARSPGSEGSNAGSGAVLGLVAAAIPMVATWGFTVDDALVSARVAHHLALGLGYRFNPGGPVVDAVTPLGWAMLLAPFAVAGVGQAWLAARGLGAVAWLLSASWLGVRLAGCSGSRLRFAPLLVVATCAPLGAWAGAGMETGVVTALATLALAPTRWGIVAGGLAAGWRPELLPWIVTLALGRAWAAGQLEPASPQPFRIGGWLLLALAPALVLALVRYACFGSPAPLAVVAKPSDLWHGALYLTRAAIWTGVPLLLLAPWALARAPRATRAVTAAVVVHGVAITFAGGDWMPLFRLLVPVMPGAILVAGELTAYAPRWSVWLRTGLASAVGALLLGAQGGEFRGVAAHRGALMSEARPLLTTARRVAALDVGWVGAMGPWQVVDLAGITDPSIAILPGGHTSKRIPHDLVDSRDVDHVVLLLAPGAAPGEPWSHSYFARAVEARLAEDARERGFALVGTVALGGTSQRYLVVRRR